MTQMTNITKIVTELLDSPIAFNPAFARLVGNNLAAGMLLSQLFYWAKTKSFAEFYKTGQELQAECFLGRTEFETARKKVTDTGIFKVVKKGLPCKTYYQIDLDVLVQKLSGLAEEPTNKFAENQQTGMQETSKQECGKPANSDAENQQTYINNRDYTETTTENIPPTPCEGETKPAKLKPFSNSLSEKTLKVLADNAFTLWKMEANSMGFEFTQSEWGAIGQYVETKLNTPRHVIRSQLILLDIWAREGLNIEQSLLRSCNSKVLITPLQAKVYDAKKNRIYDTEKIAELRQRQIEAERPKKAL